MKASRRFAFAVAAFAVLAFGGPARAEDSAYCKKVRARAAGDAALMFAPTLQAQGIRFPATGAIDTGVTSGSGYQIRGALSWSPLDFYKGFRVMKLGEADCQRQESVVTAQELLVIGSDYGKLPAYRRQAAFLDARRSTWEAIVARSDERLEAHVTSLVEANEIRSRATELERRRAQVGGEIARLEARGIDSRRMMTSQLAAAVEASTMRFEREASHVRSLDAWDFRVTGGVVPSASPVDYYGVAQVGFNFGAFTRNASETRYLDARAEELRKARYEVREQLRVFRDVVRSTREATARELDLVNKRSSDLIAMRGTLARSEAPSAAHALAIVDLHILSIEADRIQLTALIDELKSLEES